MVTIDKLAAKKKAADYNSKSIESLRYPENVRRNPSMYIGGTDAHGAFVICRELCDNFVDEFLAGRNLSGGIHVDTDGSYWVEDYGSGIPQGIKVEEQQINGKTVKVKIPTMQAVFGVLHTSGKFKSDAYAVSIGSHGVGVKGTNAVSDYFDVLTCYKGKWFKVGFKKGILTTEVQPAKAPKSPISGKTMSAGTLIHYKPDATIFSVKSFPPQMLVEWAEVQSYLNAGLRITVSIKGKAKEFFSKAGPKDYINKRLVILQAASEPDMFEFNNELANVVVAFSNADGLELKGFTNGLANSQGGKHVDSVVNALYEAIVPHMTGVKKVEGKTKYPFTPRDFGDGMLGIVNAKLHKAAFSSQDKAKLTDDRMGAPFRAIVLAVAKKFFAQNKAMAKRLCDRAAKINELKTKFTASKAVASALNGLKRNGMPGNYAPAARGTPIEKRELFIVEGESAGGGFRQVRLPHQALLPLTGKIMNSMRAKGDKALLSKAILNILGAIGFDPKQADPLKKLQIGKVILLADADPDGPLRGSTRIKLLDGTSPTIEEITNKWNEDFTPFWVWGVDEEGNPVPAVAHAPRIATRVDSALEIEFDDGTNVVCTPNHKWVANYASHTEGSVHDLVHIVKAKYLKPGDSITSVNFDTTASRTNSDRLYTRLSVDGKMMMAHRYVMKCVKPKRYARYKKDNTGSGIGGHTHIHHVNDLSLDNRPENLGVLTKEDHGASWRPRPLVVKVVNSYPTQKVTKFLRMCQRVLSKTGRLDEATYDSVRSEWVASKKIARGTPKWGTIFPLLKVSAAKLPALVKREAGNHKIVSIKEIPCDQEPMYCLSVPATGNFLIEDKHGNGIASGNSHINCLLHALISKYMPGMYDQGMVYVADMPEFYAIKDDRVFMGDTLSDVQKKLAVAKVRAEVLHAKGWGEVDPQVLEILAVGGARRLIKINPLSANDNAIFGALMGQALEGLEGEDPDKPSRGPRAPAAKKAVPAKKAVKRPVTKRQPELV